MRIKRITSRYRRDFIAIYECENCKHEEKSSGYDDKNYHNNVIPDMDCNKCGKKAPKSYKPLSPKYAEHVII